MESKKYLGISKALQSVPLKLGNRTKIELGLWTNHKVTGYRETVRGRRKSMDFEVGLT